MDLTKKTDVPSDQVPPNQEPSNQGPSNQGPSNNRITFQNIKKIVWLILFITSIVLLAFEFFGDSTSKDKDKAAEIADQLLVDFNSGVPFYYTESYIVDGNSGDFIYARDSENNLFTSDIGIYDSEPYEYIEYRIDDVYYINENGTFVESATDEYDPAAYFEQQLTVVADSIKFCAGDSFDPKIDTDFAVDGDNYVITGLYNDDVSEYTLILSKDGKTMNYFDETGTVTLDFNYSEKIELPN